MQKGLRKISTRNMPRSEWLELRRKSIGGSDASAIVGLNDWASPFTVWADKTGKLPEKPDNEAMRQGRDFEGYVASRWTEATGKAVRRENYLIRNPAYPFAHADIDRWVMGENAGLECKTTSVMNLKHFNNGEFPANYYVQCVHYMAVTGADRWYLGVLVLNQGFYEFVIERDEDEISALMTQEASFWRMVENDIPPAPDGSEATGDALHVIYKGGDTGELELFGRELLLREYFDLKSTADGISGRMAEIKQTLMLDMGDAEKGFCQDYKISWAPQRRTSFDYKAFAADNPRLDLEPYIKTTTSRPFKITQQKIKEDTRHGK